MTLVIGSVIVVLGLLLGVPLYYYRYNRSDNKASISKNPNYGSFQFEWHFFLIFNYFVLELYTPDQWEIDKDSVTLDKLIGQGHFGQVYQGVLKLSDGTLKACAVKVRRIERSEVHCMWTKISLLNFV